MGTARRQHGKVYEGHTLPYGTLANASYELRQAYYSNGYLHDKDMPELPCPPRDYQEWVDPEEELSKKEMVGVVGEVLEGLTPREAKVLYLRFGIGLTQDYTLDEVGVYFDVTKERIRQIEAKALRKMKHPQRSDKLRELLGWYETEYERHAQHKKLQEQWQKERERARQREEEAKAYAAKQRAEARARTKTDAELTEARADRALLKKWEEIKPMVSDVDWVAHLKKADPAMYQELKYMVGDIWGKNARIIWEMYAEKK